MASRMLPPRPEPNATPVMRRTAMWMFEHSVADFVDSLKHEHCAERR